MGSQLDIKSEDAYRLASRLAALTGESLTSVVTRALRSELERQESARDVEAEVERMLAMGREILQSYDRACKFRPQRPL